MAAELGIGEITLRDIVKELEKPARDPRDDMPKPILRSDVLEMKDLKEGMVLKGTVRNVIDFSYCDDGELAQMRVYHDRLRVRITDNADTRTTFELRKFRFKLRAEIRTLQIVDRTHKSLSLGIRSQTTSFCS